MNLRCGLSGLPTNWADKESAVASLLVEEVEADRWVPLTPPVTAESTPYKLHVGARVEALFKNGVLTTDSPEDLAAHRKPGTKGTQLDKFLAHARSGLVKGFALKIAGHRVLPAVYLADVAKALAAAANLEQRPAVEQAFFAKRSDTAARKAYVEYLLSQNRQALADYYRTEAERGTFGAFKEPDPSFPFEPFRLVIHWAVEKRGGLKPAQPLDAGFDEKQLARDAWIGDEPAIAKLVATVKPEWVAEWKAGGGATTSIAKESRAGRPYAAGERYAVGDIVTHPTFGPGLVEELVAPNKLRIRFGHQLKTLVHQRG